MFEKVTEEQRQSTYKLWTLYNILSAAQGFFMVALELIGMYIAIKLWLDGSISAGTVVLVQMYVAIIFGNLWGLGKSIIKFATAVSDAAEMVDIFETRPDVMDVEDPVVFRMERGEIEFKNVTFSYGEGGEVLNNFYLKINPGQKVGLVGESGAGKSTITKILLRFADVSEGEVLINGQNISKVAQDDLRRSISYVPQEPLLFHRSLKENIKYGKPEASNEEVIEVAKRARAHEFISSLSSGYDTLVGERGIKLSGGERQRVAIARAMLENAPIVVLDEATSSLDSISEKAIQEAFEELLKSKTAIVIAHRLSTIRKMDRIIVMDRGKIVEDGTHKDLLEKDGFYHNLWEHQQGGFLAE
jgi:ATP-binding cassette subfamily B protein